MIKAKTPQSPLHTAIIGHEAATKAIFKPTKDFYESVGINRIRFWQLVKGKKEPFASEILTLSKYFNVSPSQLITNEKPGHY